MNGLWAKDFSKQQIIDCTYHQYQEFNNSCNGGNPYNVLTYFNKTNMQPIPTDQPPLRPSEPCDDVDDAGVGWDGAGIGPWSVAPM